MSEKQERKRGFEICKDKEGILPKRATKSSAGYDFYATEDQVIPSIWKTVFKSLISKINKDSEIENLNKRLKPKIIFTNIKAYMAEDEYLALYNRSSNPIKRFLIQTNGVGVIDSDYYENPDNDGNIGFQFLNFGFKDVVIRKGDAIGQGIFQKFLKADNEEGPTRERTGGHGHTDN